MDIFSKTDDYGQKKVIKVLSRIFKKFNPRFIQHTEDKNRIDIEMVITKDGKDIKYVYECKDRYFPSDRYSTYIIEDGKIEILEDYSKRGYRAIYANTFSDDVMMCWEINDTTEYEMLGDRYYSTTTVVEGKRYKKNKRAVKRDRAIWTGEMK